MPDLRGTFFQIDASRFERCLYPGLTCDATPIRAHSIQNAAHLGLLEQDGHVVQLTRRFKPEGPEILFERVGRNKASTFEGLCSNHDQELFGPIETDPVNLGDEWHLFLLAYRAVLRELHATMAVASKAQAFYLARLEAGLDPKGTPSPAGVFATQRMIISWETNTLKEAFDAAYVEHAPALLAHDVLLFDVKEPSVGASALFSLDGLDRDGQPVRACLTILPMSEAVTAVVLSYLQQERGLARVRLARVLQAQGYHQMYEVSRLLLNSCENFVVNPRVYSTWSPEKREAIRAHFVRTLFSDDFGSEDEGLMLFATGT